MSTRATDKPVVIAPCVEPTKSTRLLEEFDALSITHSNAARRLVEAVQTIKANHKKK